MKPDRRRMIVAEIIFPCQYTFAEYSVSAALAHAREIVEDLPHDKHSAKVRICTWYLQAQLTEVQWVPVEEPYVVPL